MGDLVLSGKSREAAEALVKLAKEWGLGIEIARGGKHPYAEFSKNGQRRKVYFSGTTANWRLVDNVIRDAKQAFRVMGWEKTVVNLVQTGKGSMFDAREASQGPAGPVKIIQPDGALGSALKEALEKSKVMLRGVLVPEVPEVGRTKYQPSRAKSDIRYRHDYRAWLGVRGAFVDAATSAGATVLECAEALCKAGHPCLPASLSARRSNKKEYKRRTTADLIAPKSVAKREESPSDASKIRTAIMGLIDELVKAETAELRAKADKWDAIKGLVSGE